jgi:sorbitol-6-phosphate 2-dehydrogenase
MSRLRGKVAAITGGGSGIGRATAQQFQDEEATVYTLDSRAGPGVDLIVDVTDEDGIRKTFASILEQSGTLDVCVANAGIIQMGATATQLLTDWERTISVNLTGAFLTLRTAARTMLEGEHGGVLLAVSSGAGLRGEAGAGAYSASKFGLVGLVQSMALELAPAGIRVAGVAPGEIDTPLMDRLLAEAANDQGIGADGLKTRLAAQIPMRRFGTASEVATVLAFLASDEASYITGEIIRVDGGELVSGQTIPPPTAIGRMVAGAE